MKILAGLFVVIAALLMSGCASDDYAQVQLPPPPTLDQIKELAAKDVSDKTIIDMLRASRAVYHLTADQVKNLQEANVSQAVIDYLLSTPKLYPQPVVVHRYYYYPEPYWHHHWHFGGYYHHYPHHHFHHGHRHGSSIAIKR